MAEFCTTKAAAELCGAARSTITKRCREGAFPGAFKAGRDWLIPVAELPLFRKRSPGRKPGDSSGRLGEIS